MSDAVETLLAGFNGWLASRAAFVQLSLLTVGWTAVALIGIDEHGFWFLYFATAFSFVTQANLAIFASRAGTAARQADDRAYETLQRMEASDENDGEVLLSLERALTNQQTMIEAVIELTHEGVEARKDMASALEIVDKTVDRLADFATAGHLADEQMNNAIRRLEEVASSASERHDRNEAMIARILEAIQDALPDR